MIDPAELRLDYHRDTLDLDRVAADPIEQFLHWFTEAESGEVLEPNAMTLATANADGDPSARIVLLKGVTSQGFDFFTDYRSQKGRELTENPRAALVFHWGPMERQVRIHGRVEKLSREASEAYFSSRPEGSRIGAWVSEQSRVIADRSVLTHTREEVVKRFVGGQIPLPPYWGGFRVVPDRLEFWQGRPDRLHDRINYTFNPELGWSRVRLSP